MDASGIKELERQKWHAKRREVEDDLESVQAKLELIIPKDKNNIGQWRNYYVQRVQILESPSFHPVSKLVCTNCKSKKELVREFFDVLDALQSGVDAEDDLGSIEFEADKIVKEEAARLRSEQPQFYAN